MTKKSSSALTNFFFQSPNHSSLLHYLRRILTNPISLLLMNGLCPWLWAPTLPQRWKLTIRLSLYVLSFRIFSPFNDPYRPSKTSQKLQVGHSTRVFFSPWSLKQIIGAGLNWVRIPIGFWAIETMNNEPFLVGTSWKYFLKAWAIPAPFFHSQRTQPLTSSSFQYSMGKEIWPSYISRSPCTSWKSKWLGESSNFCHIINFLPLRHRIIPEKVRICYYTFIEGAWNWRGSYLSLPLSFLGGSVNLWVLLVTALSAPLFTADYW